MPILHLVEWGAQSYVKFAHARIGTSYETTGDRRAWYWHHQDGYYRYGLILEPDLQVWYHDFTRTDAQGLSEPLDHFICQQIQ